MLLLIKRRSHEKSCTNLSYYILTVSWKISMPYNKTTDHETVCQMAFSIVTKNCLITNCNRRTGDSGFWNFMLKVKYFIFFSIHKYRSICLYQFSMRSKLKVFYILIRTGTTIKLLVNEIYCCRNFALHWYASDCT